MCEAYVLPFIRYSFCGLFLCNKRICFLPKFERQNFWNFSPHFLTKQLEMYMIGFLQLSTPQINFKVNYSCVTGISSHTWNVRYSRYSVPNEIQRMIRSKIALYLIKSTYNELLASRAMSPSVSILYHIKPRTFPVQLVFFAFHDFANDSRCRLRFVHWMKTDKH